MRFASPWFLILLPIVLLIIIVRKQTREVSTIKYSDVRKLRHLENNKTKLFVNLSKWLRYAMLCLVILALARPQGVSVEKDIFTDGIDIVLALDVSGSMKAEDFKPHNRLEVAKDTIKTFIAKRYSDRIGLVVFGGEAFTQCPLTLDMGVLKAFLAQVRLDMAGDGTAIGMAIASALNRLKHSKAKTKIIILLTDGVNNKGEIDPLSAADLAKEMGIKIYTIGIGKEGGAPIPIDDPVYGRIYLRKPNGKLFLTQIDEETLKQIALKTDARYFRALDKKGLEKIYNLIDKLEKTKIKTKQYYNYTEYFPKLIWLVFVLFLLEVLITKIFLMRIP
jgi:Ca-activated chloride channel family protein